MPASAFSLPGRSCRTAHREPWPWRPASVDRRSREFSYDRRRASTSNHRTVAIINRATGDREMRWEDADQSAEPNRKELCRAGRRLAARPGFYEAVRMYRRGGTDRWRLLSEPWK